MVDGDDGFALNTLSLEYITKKVQNLLRLCHFSLKPRHFTNVVYLANFDRKSSTWTLVNLRDTANADIDNFYNFLLSFLLPLLVAKALQPAIGNDRQGSLSSALDQGAWGWRGRPSLVVTFGLLPAITKARQPADKEKFQPFTHRTKMTPATNFHPLSPLNHHTSSSTLWNYSFILLLLIAFGHGQRMLFSSPSLKQWERKWFLDWPFTPFHAPLRKSFRWEFCQI